MNHDGEHDSETPNARNDYDWWAKDGVLRGRHRPLSGLGKASVEQSRLYYDRPLLAGERIRYEFWYETGAADSQVAPALDRLAFLLDPDGVKLHWMTDGGSPEDAYAGLSPDNELTEPALQRGKVALKHGDWNVVELSLKEDVVTITLNDAVVAERKLEPENSRQFGFYHDKNATSVQVRNVVLSGDWPKSLSPEIESNLFASSKPRTPVERSAYGRVIDEKFYASNLDQLLRQTHSADGSPISETEGLGLTERRPRRVPSVCGIHRRLRVAGNERIHGGSSLIVSSENPFAGKNREASSFHRLSI